jgi:hypothetical protein
MLDMGPLKCKEMNNIPTSYLLWFCWFFGFAGLHRIYNKKFFTGFLWFCTWGLFGIGQIVDILLIPSMVHEHNLKVRQRLGLSSTGVPLNPSPNEISQLYNLPPSQPLSQQEIMIKLAQAAAKRGGKLSLTQAVIDIEISFEEAEKTLNEMLKKGYVAIDNDPDTGAVIYDFLEI